MTSDFQRAFLSRGTGNKLFTQEEFDAELQAAQTEIVAMAVAATREAVVIERKACAEMVEQWADEVDLKKIADAIRDRIPSQNQ